MTSRDDINIVTRSQSSPGATTSDNWAARLERDDAVQAIRKAEARRRDRSLQAFLLVTLGILSWAVLWCIYQVAVSL